MKKLLVSIIAGLTLMAASTSIVSAAAPTTPRMVNGVIGTNTTPEGGAKVSATCSGTTKTTTANDGGFYMFEFNSDNCPDGSTVTVSATKGDKSGAASKTIDGFVTSVNVPLSQATAVPEMGTYASLAAVAAVGGSLVVMRRKQLQKQA